jgi:hypothetical protein
MDLNNVVMQINVSNILCFYALWSYIVAIPQYKLDWG